MTFGLRIVVVAFAAFAASGLVGALVAWLWVRRTQGAPLTDTTLLFQRLLPTLCGVGATSLGLLAFVLFEPRGPEETGLVLRALAGLGAVLLATAAWRGFRLYRRTRRTVRQWMASAEEVVLPGIDTPIFAVSAAFPIVAVVGLVRQRVIIARSVVEACSADEVGAILAHEQIHIDRYDNVRRAMLTVAPDLLSWLPLSDRLLDAWHERCEESADTGAGRLGERGRVLLAQALIRVARLAPAPTAVHDLPASALYRGEDLGRRIHRLLAPPIVATAPQRMIHYAVALGILTSLLALRPIHDVVEAAVTWLP
ncbi:MAG TPA: M56 family metallopeptidase [Vicinamibacterales bacterium]|nr:M56 family metallopeptidase [Vicinamibacterales bacterium]